jgi:hypothetical protein
MKKQYISFFSLLISAMLLFPLGSLFADVTVSFQDAEFMYNTTGNIIEVNVSTDEDIQAFDLLAEVTSTVTNAFGTVTNVTLTGIPDSDFDLAQVDGSSADVVRMWGFDPANTMQMPVGDYTFEIEVTTNCDTGQFTLECYDGWSVDPLPPVVANTHFSTPAAATATYTCDGGAYRVYNTAPTITNCPDPAVFNACDVIQYDFDADDPDNACTAQNLTWDIVGGNAGGSIDDETGQYLWDPPAVYDICGMYDLLVRVTDEWGAYDECEWIITLESDPPEFTDCPTEDSELFIYWGWTADGDVDAIDPDDCPLPLVYELVSFSGPGTFTVDPNTGVWDWPTVFGDDAYLGDFDVVIKVTDSCSATSYDLCEFTIHVAPTFEVRIEKIHNQLQGHYAYVNIFLDHWTEGFGGYDFLVAYDASALTFVKADPGDVLTTCGFEYFTYSFGAQGNCDGPCPSGFARVVAIADWNNGANHPSCYGEGLTGSLATLKFLVTNDRTYGCQFVPVSFYWFDCGDNGISSISGDTLFLSAHVYGYDTQGELTGTPGYGGWQGTGLDCLEGDKVHPDTVVNFFNGGVDIVCPESIDARGDINLNGIDNEIADAVLFTNYFLHGIVVFDHVEAQIAATDVNNDGQTLTVGDLVYLVRIITGDALPYPKLAPFASTVDVEVVNGMVTTSSSEDIGGLYMTFNVGVDYNVISHTDMEVLYNERDGQLHMLVYSGFDTPTNAIVAGESELVTVVGGELASVEVADYNGNLMNVRVEKTALPTEFNLGQNVPNPFNPTTKIGFDLPVITDWTLDIYNVNGQLIQSFNGTNIGHTEVTWDAASVASGIYFYRLSAGSFTDTKKMVLMK